jgi:hypothetical protein
MHAKGRRVEREHGFHRVSLSCLMLASTPPNHAMPESP